MKSISMLRTSLAACLLLGAAFVAPAQIRIAAVGASSGNRAADTICSSGDLNCTIDRISAAAYNAMSVADLRSQYDVLIFTWATTPALNADWSTRIAPFLALQGGVIFDGDPNNVADLAPAVTGVPASGFPISVTAAIPGLTDGIGNDFDNNHIRFTDSAPEFTRFIDAGGQVAGLAGDIGGCRAVITGPDQDYHAHRTFNSNQYNLLVNEIAWVASCDSDGPITSNLATDPVSPVSVNDAVIITANVDDSTTGGSDIASASCTLTNTSTDPPTEISCDPVETDDMNYNAVSEDVKAMVSAGTLSAGVYNLCINGTDAAGNVGADECSFFVVYDPSEGFVTGGGWIDSPAGSLVASPEASGRANFGFVSKYRKGAAKPTGQTQFQFKAGDLNFHSSSYQWLVIGGPLAQYKGTGTINGGGNYGFLLTAKDSAISGGPAQDTFRIKIWDIDNEDAPVYDNGTDQAVDGGSIVIHAK